MAAKRTLVLIRHGESEANAANRFTGVSESPLTSRGEEQMREVARHLARLDLPPDRMFCSGLERTLASARIIADHMRAGSCPITAAPALNERDYGELTGFNKTEAARLWGSEQIRLWRRSYTATPPGGESLRDTVARVVPCYLHDVLPAALAGGNTFVVAHGNSLRALIMALESIAPADMPSLQLETGTALIFSLAEDTRVARLKTIIPEEQTWS